MTQRTLYAPVVDLSSVTHGLFVLPCTTDCLGVRKRIRVTNPHLFTVLDYYKTA
jgi:hypothetical protein